MVHQNRFKGNFIGRSRKSYLPESFIPSFINLVIWGHEHECFTEPKLNQDMGFYVYQPGSSVATSLIYAESKQKHVGYLEICNENFRITPVKLDSVRPFIHLNLELSEFALNISSNEDIQNLIEEKIEEMLKLNETTNPNNPLLPILRLKVEYSGFTMVRTNFIVNKYTGKIANPVDVVQYHRKTDPIKVQSHHSCHGDDDEDLKGHISNLEDEMAGNYDILKFFMNNSIKSYFETKQDQPLIPSDVFCDSLEKHVNMNDKKAFDTLYKNFFDFYQRNCQVDQKLLMDFSPFDKKDYSLVPYDILKKFNNTKIISSSNDHSNSNVSSYRDIDRNSSENSYLQRGANRKKFLKSHINNKINEEEVDFDKFEKDEMKDNLMELQNEINEGKRKSFFNDEDIAIENKFNNIQQEKLLKKNHIQEPNIQTNPNSNMLFTSNNNILNQNKRKYVATKDAPNIKKMRYE